MAGEGEKEDVPMAEAEKKKISTEDLLRMSMDSISLLDGPKEEKKELTREEAHDLVVSELKTNISLCEKTATTKEVRFILRALRRTSSLRSKITKRILREFIQTYFPENNPQKENILNFIEEVTDDEDLESMEFADQKPATEILAPKPDSIIPEIEIYLSLVTLIFLIDHRVYSLAVDYSNSVTSLLKGESFNVRTLDPLRAKVYFYFSRSYEHSERLGDIRPELLKVYRTASLRHDTITQATVLNLLLRNYLEYNLYDQANKFISNINEFRDVAASSNQHARYLYYTGRIKAVQLDYSDAYTHLSQALRKAPQYSALGFRKTVQKLLIIVQLLMGDIPERNVFRQTSLQSALVPYFKLTMAVRVADLGKFKEVVSQYREVFLADKNLSLIQRIRKNVIKTGLRKINASYSRISLQDIRKKLNLIEESVEDIEFIVSKAIRDNVIDATIDHENQYLKSKETVDIYSTQEPLEAFHKRINFCLNIHNDAVMAMRFPASSKSRETDEERRERIKLEQELEEFDEEDEEDF